MDLRRWTVIVYCSKSLVLNLHILTIYIPCVENNFLTKSRYNLLDNNPDIEIFEYDGFESHWFNETKFSPIFFFFLRHQ